MKTVTRTALTDKTGNVARGPVAVAMPPRAGDPPRRSGVGSRGLSLPRDPTFVHQRFPAHSNQRRTFP